MSSYSILRALDIARVGHIARGILYITRLYIVRYHITRLYIARHHTWRAYVHLHARYAYRKYGNYSRFRLNICIASIENIHTFA